MLKLTRWTVWQANKFASLMNFVNAKEHICRWDVIAAASWRAFAACFLALQLNSASGQTSTPDVTVEITGRGVDLQMARQDAIRQALQKVIPQIIVADRRIENDTVIFDRVMSSMDGHVKSIDQIERHSIGEEVAARFRIVVSPRDLANFIQFGAGSKKKFEGDLLFGSILREKEARSYRNYYLERFFRGYPAEALEATISKVKPNSMNPDVVDLTITYRFRPAWIEALKAGLKEIRCESDDRDECSNQRVCFTTDYLYTASQCISLAFGPGMPEIELRPSATFPILNTSTDPIIFFVFLKDVKGQILGSPFCHMESGRLRSGTRGGDGSFYSDRVFSSKTYDDIMRINVATRRQDLEKAINIEVAKFIIASFVSLKEDSIRTRLRGSLVDPDKDDDVEFRGICDNYGRWIKP